MIILSGLLFGALLGALRARRRQGSSADIAQYAAVHAILFALIGLFVTLALGRIG